MVASSKLSPHAPTFVPRSQFQSPLQSKPSHLLARSNGPDSVLIDCVKDTIYQLSLDPGEFEAIVEGLVETMEGWISQDETLTEIADIIVNQVSSRSERLVFQEENLFSALVSKLKIG